MPKRVNYLNGYFVVPEHAECSGAYGIVRKFKHPETNEMRAVKIPKVNCEAWLDTLANEIDAFSQMSHPNVLKLYSGSVRHERGNYLIMEWMDMDLAKYIKHCGGVIPNQQAIFDQIKYGLEHVHSKGFMHRDLKTSNILVSDNGQIAKISDFGVSKRYVKERENTIADICTLWYRAPEIALRDKFYDFAVDIWSLGCIRYEIQHGHPPFYCEIDRGYDLLLAMFRVTGTPEEFAVPNGTFPRWPAPPGWVPCPMLSYNPKLRPSSPAKCMY